MNIAIKTTTFLLFFGFLYGMHLSLDQMRFINGNVILEQPAGSILALSIFFDDFDQIVAQERERIKNLCVKESLNQDIKDLTLGCSVTVVPYVSHMCCPTYSGIVSLGACLCAGKFCFEMHSKRKAFSRNLIRQERWLNYLVELRKAWLAENFQG